MVLSGLILVTQSTMGIFSGANPGFSVEPLQKGVEAKLKWQHANFSLEFTLDDKLEFEWSNSA